MNNILIHHGIKGQRWGVRRYQNEDGTLTEAGKAKYGGQDTQPYSDKQYKRDKTVYGTLAAGRINRKILKGGQISGARSKEADRISTTRKVANISGKVGKIAGSILGTYGSYKLGVKYIRSTGDSTADAALRVAVLGGGAAIGSMLGKYGGQSLAMLAGGYSPGKFRD